jgi:hypothetical protein
MQPPRLRPSAAGSAPATASTASTPAAAIAASPAESASTFRLGPRFVHRERPAPELRRVQLRDGLLRIGVAAHLDERESAGAPRRHVAYDPYGLDGACLLEQRL